MSFHHFLGTSITSDWGHEVRSASSDVLNNERVASATDGVLVGSRVKIKPFNGLLVVEWVWVAEPDE